MENLDKIKATTIICIKRFNSIAMIADSQVTRGSFIVKNNVNKIKRLKNKEILIGMAGSVTDCLTLIDHLEIKLKDFANLERACYELMKDWRNNKYMRHLEAELIICNKENIFILSGTGLIMEPEKKDIASIGSGSIFAISAAKALYENTEMNALEIAKKSMEIASSLCIYTNNNFTIEELKF